MLRRIDERREDERGFTLIELMVVVLIIGILIAIALPTFLGARQRAADREAESRLRSAYTAARIYFTDNESYVGVDGPGVLAGVENSLISNTLPPPGAITNQVSVRDVSDGTVLLVTRSTSGAYVCMAGDPGGQVRGLDAAADPFATVADCAAAPSSW
ncbi:MAG: type II secretion system protein [Actinomycetota bacterium]